MMAEKGFAFAFVEGALVKAVREGWWLLLDEINLAPAEVCFPNQQKLCFAFLDNFLVLCTQDSLHHCSLMS